MSLTVPMAGLIAGRAAEPQFEARQTGSALAGFGTALKDLGDRLEQQRLDLEEGQLKLDMTRDMDALRLKYEGMGDAAAINQGWATDIAALRQSYFGQAGGGGHPRVDPKLAPQFGLAFEDLAERHGFALGARVVALRQSQSVATHIAYRATAEQAAAAADPQTAATIAEQYDQSLAQQVKSGAMSPDDAARDSLAFRQGSDLNRGVRLLEAGNVEAVRQGLAAGSFPNLTPEDRNRLTAGINAADARAASAAEVVVRQQDDAARAEIRDGIAVMSKGLIWAGEAKLADPAFAARYPELVAEARGTLALRDEGKPILQMTRPQLVAELATVQAKTYSKPYQTERAAALQGRLKDYDTQWGKDQIAAATAADLPVPKVAPFDPANPAAYAKSLADRAAFAGWAEEKGYVAKGKMRLLSDAEATDLKPAIASTADATTRLAAASALAALPNGKGDGVAAAAGASPVFLFGMNTLADKGNPGLVTSMLRGEAKIDAGTVAMPSDKDMTQIFNKVTGGVFRDDPQTQKELLAVTKSIYADGAIGLDPETIKAGGWLTSEAAQNVYAIAVQQAFGGSPDASGNMTVGGVQDVAGTAIVLPPGMAADSANEAWGHLQAQLIGKEFRSDVGDWLPAGATLDPNTHAQIRNPTAEAAVDRLRGLAAAAQFKGMRPDDGATNPARAGDLRPQRVGPDRYVLEFDRAGRTFYVENAGGARNPDGTNLFVFSMSALPEATRQ